MADHDRALWQDRWLRALAEHGDRLAERPPNVHLTTELDGLPAGRALDAGCGHGAETVWLASRGWRVTAVDFATAALARARSAAAAAGPRIAERIDWVDADLSAWSPAPEAYDLVVCLYLHAGDSAAQLVRRMAAAVAPGGTLFMTGHRPVDPATGRETAAAGQVQVSEDDACALEPGGWELVVAEHRPRAAAGTGVDAVIRARRR